MTERLFTILTLTIALGDLACFEGGERANPGLQDTITVPDRPVAAIDVVGIVVNEAGDPVVGATVELAVLYPDLATDDSRTTSMNGCNGILGPQTEVVVDRTGRFETRIFGGLPLTEHGCVTGTARPPMGTNLNDAIIEGRDARFSYNEEKVEGVDRITVSIILRRKGEG